MEGYPLKTYKKHALLIVLIPLLLNGCIPISTTTPKEIEDHKKKIEKERKERNEDVLTYTAEDYKAYDAQETEDITEELRDEIIQATKDYMKKNFHLDIQVHNILTNIDGVTVYFETKDHIHFFSEVRIPIDLINKRVLGDKVKYYDDLLDNAMKASLYAYMHEEQFSELDGLLGEVAEENDVVGIRKELIQNIGRQGYMTPYYYTNYLNSDEALIPVYQKYLDAPSSTKAELLEVFKSEDFDPEYIEIHIQLFMKEPDTEPDEKTFRLIMDKIKTGNQLPKGHYIITLNDNQKEKGTIDNRSLGSKQEEIIIE